VEKLSFGRDEIVILQESYPDLSPVAGVISTTFSTPLSHVNLRAKAWGIPNAGVVDAATRYAALHRKPVVLEVRADAYTLRAADAAEVAAWKASRQAARQVRVPPADLAATALQPLTALARADARVYGAKAANLGEIARARLRGVKVPAGFAVPFSAYAAHMKRHGLDAQLERLLADPRFAADARHRKESLAALRAKIVAAELDPDLLDAVQARIDGELGGAGVFVRSSTNAEDLEGFNGAGLYDTVPNVKGREAVAAAIKQVWASLWSSLAVEERSFFGIDQRAVYAGALVQVGVNASAAGVLVTRNLFDPEDDHSFTINAKRGLGMKVVAGTTVPEQVVYDVKYPGARIVSRSDDPTMLVFDEAGGVKEVPSTDRSVILTEARARALARAVVRFQPLFPGLPLDVEWVLEGETLWIVQARPFVSK
jgi:phosphoenolpyruvate synthase/pyruvate phosphate dikinase